MGKNAKGISRTCAYESLRNEIDAILGCYGLQVVDISVRRSSGKALVDIFLAKMSSGIANSPNTSDLEEASSVLHVFFDDYFRDQDYVMTLSSPGLNRCLKTLYELNLFNGRMANVSYSDEKGELASVVGKILSADDEKLVLFLSSGEMEIPIDSIRNAYLEE